MRIVLRLTLVFGVFAALANHAEATTFYNDFIETPGSSCQPYQESETSGSLYRNYAQMYNNTGSTQEIVCSIQHQESSLVVPTTVYSYYVNGSYVYLYDNDTTHTTSCYMTGTTSGHAANVSSSQSSTPGSGYSTLTFGSPFGTTAVNYYGMSMHCTLGANASSVQGIETYYEHS